VSETAQVELKVDECKPLMGGGMGGGGQMGGGGGQFGGGGGGMPGGWAGTSHKRSPRHPPQFQPSCVEL